MERVLVARGIRGLILYAFFDNQMEGFNYGKFCAIQASRGTWRTPLHTVSHDPMAGLLLSGQKLVEYGYRRPGFLLIDHHLSLDDDRVREAAVHLLERHTFADQAPLPILLQNDLARKGEMKRWIRREKIDVVVGFNDSRKFNSNRLGMGRWMKTGQVVGKGKMQTFQSQQAFVPQDSSRNWDIYLLINSLHLC